MYGAYNQQGGTTGGRKRKRPKSKSQKKSKQQLKANQSKSSSEFQFDVDIPDYYQYPSRRSTTAEQKRDDTPAQAKKEYDAAGGKSPEEIKVDTQVNKDKDVATIDKQDKQTSSEAEAEDPKSKRHKDFINALERYGSSDRAWDKISYHLKWTVKDVKVYAYSYFKSLIKDRTANIYEKMDLSIIANAQGLNNSTSNKATTDDDTTEDEWTFHEIILLDTLMVKYCKNISCLAEEMNNGTWQKIASQLPGRSAHTCKKEGIKRLLSLYGEGNK